jgi:uncharacterized protein with HEPN domain
MSDRVYTDYIDDIMKSAELVLEFTAGFNYSSFSNDYKTRYAVIRCFEIMGEAAKKIPDEIRMRFPSIPWKTIAATRDRLIHGYDVVDDAVVWKTVINDIPGLLKSLKSIDFK